MLGLHRKRDYGKRVTSGIKQLPDRSSKPSIKGIISQIVKRRRQNAPTHPAFQNRWETWAKSDLFCFTFASRITLFLRPFFFLAETGIFTELRLDPVFDRIESGYVVDSGEGNGVLYP